MQFHPVFRNGLWRSVPLHLPPHFGRQKMPFFLSLGQVAQGSGGVTIPEGV